MHDISLPKNIPLFPLPGVLLLPGGILPLQIFEQRYLQMIRDALQGEAIIGMIQTSSDQPYQSKPPVYSTGCTGKITYHEDTADGRILLTLQGVCRFNIIREHDDDNLYRTAEVDYLPSGNIDMEDADEKHQRLLNAAKLYLPSLVENVQIEPILEAGMPELVTVLSMYCPFSTTEKQSLLEAPNQNARVNRLITLLEQAVLNNLQSDDQKAN